MRGILSELRAQLASIGFTRERFDHECVRRHIRVAREASDATFEFFWELQARGCHGKGS
jgi:hypothetical protein